jgi:hypothetical protein
MRKSTWDNLSGSTELKSDVSNSEPSEYAAFDAEHGGSSDNASGS